MGVEYLTAVLLPTKPGHVRRRRSRWRRILRTPMALPALTNLPETVKALLRRTRSANAAAAVLDEFRGGVAGYSAGRTG